MKETSSGQHLLEAIEALRSSADNSALLTGDPTEDAHSIQLLLDTIAQVTGGLDLDAVLDDIVRKSLQLTNADRAILFLGAAADALEIRISRDKKGNLLGQNLRYSRSLLARSLKERRAVGSVIQSEGDTLELGESFYQLKLRAAMCAPMYARDHLVGAIYVDSQAWREAFSQRDLALFGALSSQLATTVERARLYADSLQKTRLERDMEIAQRIQQHLLPIVPEDIPGVEIALRFKASQGASGDCYDFIPLEDGRLAVLVGDVTGHGVGAAEMKFPVPAIDERRSFRRPTTSPGSCNSSR